MEKHTWWEEYTEVKKDTHKEKTYIKKRYIQKKKHTKLGYIWKGQTYMVRKIYKTRIILTKKGEQINIREDNILVIEEKKRDIYNKENI